MFQLMAFFLALMWAPLAMAQGYQAFRPTDERGVPPSFQAWHPEFEDNGDYGESWFFIASGDDGGLLYALISVTNLGLRTFDGSVDVQYHAADGRRWSSHHEHRRDAVKGSSERMDITIGGARAWGGGMSYHLRIDEPDVKVTLDLENELPPYRFGDGRIVFGEARDKEYTIGVNAPRARTTGSVTVGGETFDLAGTGYHDHGWATIKLPDFLSKWYSLRLYDEKYTIVLHRQFLTSKQGGGDVRFGLLGADGRIVAASRNFVFAETATRSQSGFALPKELKIAMNAGGYKVEGKLTETRFLEAVDVLAQVSLPVRLAIKAFYSNPYLLRYLVRYELDITHDGETERITGEAIMEADFY